MENQKGVIQVSKRYMVKVNGKMYEVEVEEMGSGNAQIQERTYEAPAAVQQAAAPTASVQKPQAPSNPEPAAGKPAPSGDGEKIQAPMSGVIVKIEVRPGDSVRDSQTLIILEAMKMENEILAPRDCKIKEILVREGQQVEIDQPLLVVE